MAHARENSMNSDLVAVNISCLTYISRRWHATDLYVKPHTLNGHLSEKTEVVLQTVFKPLVTAARLYSIMTKLKMKRKKVMNTFLKLFPVLNGFCQTNSVKTSMFKNLS